MSSPTLPESFARADDSRGGLIALLAAGLSIVAVAILALFTLNDRLTTQALESKARATYWSARLAELDKQHLVSAELAARGDRMFQRANVEAQKLCLGRRPDPREFVACLLVEADVAASRN